MKQWDVNWGLFRKRIVFADSPQALMQGVQDLLHMAEELIASSQKAYAIDLVKELAADLSSCLTVWKLDIAGLKPLGQASSPFHCPDGPA